MLKNILILTLFALPISSFSSENKLKSYPGKIYQIIEHIHSPDYSKVVKKATRRGKKRNRIAYLLEKARISQIKGDFETSKALFDEVLIEIKDQEDRAVISGKKVGDQAKATVVNDRMIQYKPYGYEKIWVHHFQAINYLALSNFDGGMVEIRRANLRQAQELERYRNDVIKAEEKEKDAIAGKQAEEAEAPEAKESAEPERKQKRFSLKKFLAPKEKTSKPKPKPAYEWNFIKNHVLEQDGASGTLSNDLSKQVKSSFQNAATFYLSALMYEKYGNPDDAYIDFKKALEIYDKNPYLLRDTFRVSESLGRVEELAGFTKQKTSQKAFASSNSASLIVFFEEGLAPLKEQYKITLPIENNLLSIAFPRYNKNKHQPLPLSVNNGTFLGKTEVICDVQALAVKALEEQRPLIYTRQVARIIAKATMAKVAEKEGGAVGWLTSNIYNNASEAADLRSWLSLPSNVQIAKFDISAKPQEIHLKQPRLGIDHKLSIAPKPGERVLLQVINFKNNTFVNTIYL